MDTTETCSKCGDELDTEGTPNWCRKCRAKYQREYKAIRLEMEGGKGFGRGAQAMRELLMKEFAEQGAGRFSGDEISQLIGQCPGPAPAKASDTDRD